MFAKIRSFAREEDGAVTVDWVVLSAVIVGFGIATVLAVQNGAEQGGQNIANQVSTQGALYLPE